MSSPLHPSSVSTGPVPWIVNRSVDLGSIAAVGFDLDHTLALYDDAAVNALATAEAQELLVSQRGYRASGVAAAPRPDDAAAARALAIDLRDGHAVKLDANRRVRVARRGGVWLEEEAIERAFPSVIPESNDVLHSLSSAFDLPTLWLFEMVTPISAGAQFVPSRACRHVREMLDWSHTRGELKRHLLRDLARYVSPIPGAAARREEWRRAGKQLFVVTNSDLEFASQVLDIAVGPHWRTLFAAVCTSSAKPAFFDRSAIRAGARAPIPDATVFEGAHAEVLETLLGARGERVLYVGDNVLADIRAARSFGWKTAHVVAELSATDSSRDGWGSPLKVGADATWFARVISQSADMVCDRVDRFLNLEPDHRAQVASSRADGESA